MEFSDKVKELAKRSHNAAQHALTEEATKTSVVLPLLQVLGFDPFNLAEVTPEFVADVGIKKGEKIDFAVKIDGKNALLVEVKPISQPLGSAQYSQLYRYFGVTEARLAMLTNGRDIWFFSDIDAPNKMDKKPFFSFDLQAYNQNQLSELARFQKDNFDINSILEAASNLKYVEMAADFLKNQLDNPSDDFVKLIGRSIYDGSLTKGVMELLRPAVQVALDEVVRDRIQDKLSISLPTKPAAEAREPMAVPEAEASDVHTTEEEQQAFMIVRAIGAEIVPVDRITIRDSKSYCSIFVDNKNNRPVCRLYFNAKSVKRIGVFDSEKNEVRHEIAGLSDIYKYSEQLRAAIQAYS